jgi:hypothetical protein
VDWSLWVEILKSDGMFVFSDSLGRDFPIDDLAKNTIQVCLRNHFSH